MENTEKKSRNFIQEIIDKDLETKKYDYVYTRFPPEPNGYLHIGHALSIYLNFSFGEEYNGKTNLRFDDTNPTKEDVEYVESIMEDVKWLGFQWEGKELYASDYFEQLYDYAVTLIKKGLAYVDSSSLDEIKNERGTPTEPGKESKYRSRTVEENLDLFARMRNGEFKDGEHVLRAKIDMRSPNMNLRDPIMYRIRHAHHHRTGDKWCIYPMYDWAHGQSDSVEGITHSICTLEFENHRPLYNWFIEQLGIHHPRQIEFARLNLNYTVMSKRKLLRLVQEGFVSGWDDPRMPTISALRRRGYTPQSIRNFTKRVGVAKRDGVNDVSLLEFSIREDLNEHAPRVMAVLDPLKVVITNYEENKVEELEAVNNPQDESMGKRLIPFSNEIYVERTDFQEVPHKKFHRLTEGSEVRLRYAYIIKCEKVIKDNSGNVIELQCTYDPDTKSGSGKSDKKVKGTIHWVSANHSLNAEVRLYDRLFSVEFPEEDKERDFTEFINPESLKVLNNCKVERSLSTAQPGDKYQFERNGYFCVDLKDSKTESLVFNRTVTLKDTWSKIANK
ncbi:MAG: glutamine--tRNA ligase/YqeY domain fusion protein [Ignavibacteriae bacterium]|nr:glutamine--tRNA ligase/YqeY domain fusion protein [Ignavibacteriota bacterium]MCB9206566.1 glutamine--tRNA ligase/YqeY domain fusion protein [Ignavibacteriales bacterium]MCB9209654.1 glutamine--tRNA ligase/YqeY domain fusion protein [Ignavibacteriales bacterium]MCB9218810.1 glutamine--tRNA ligase/YqeY domain fusion protein [Ignavibacteriales bacterium]